MCISPPGVRRAFAVKAARAKPAPSDGDQGCDAAAQLMDKGRMQHSKVPAPPPRWQGFRRFGDNAASSGSRHPAAIAGFSGNHKNRLNLDQIGRSF